MTPTAAAVWHPPGAMVGGASYRQLRSLRSLAGGYDYIALRAGDAAYGKKAPCNGEKGLSKAAIKVIKLLEHECGLREITIFIQHSNLTKLRNGIMASLIEAGFVELSQPDSPRSPTQKYRLTEKSCALLKELGQE